MKKTTIVILIILLSVMCASSLMYGKIPKQENIALQTLFNATGGSNWLNKKNWKGAPGTEHTWYGITCDAGNTTVLKIELVNNKLEGKLPVELSDLQNLDSLVLSDNQLTETHKELGKLSKLTTLDLSNNQLTGEIPSWIQNLKNLKNLNLSYNGLTGGIPSWIGKLKNLEVLLLDGNHLKGPLPAELGNLSKLTVIRIGHNRLTGKIPDAVGKLTRLADNRSNFKWNGLYTDEASLKTFLKKKQTGNDWESTQTTAPGGITAFSPSKTSIRIDWDPIDYTADSGSYQVFYSTTPGGPYTPGPTTDDKTKAKTMVTGLAPSTRYYFVVRTRTTRHGSNRNSIESEFSKEISATTRGITISGSVTTSKGEGVQGVEITASNEGGSVFTNAEGNYDLGVTPQWSGTVTATKKGYDFQPASLEYTNVNEDVPNQHYTAEANTIISGQVTNSTGKGVPGVTLIFSGSKGKPTFSTETDPGGNYSQAVTYKWAGTVKLTKAGVKFEPSTRTYTDVISALPGNKYLAFMPPEISGRVKNRRGKGMPDLTLTFSNREGAADTIKTGKNGEYSKVVVINWSGTVTPEKKGYIFSPPKRDYVKMTTDTVKRAEDFKAERDFRLFITVTGSYTLPADSRFDDIYGSRIISPDITVELKLYRGFFIWGGFGFFSKNGKSIELEEPSKWKQRFLSLGIGYYKNLSVQLGWKVRVGALLTHYSEEAFGDKFSTNNVGARLDTAGILKLTDRLSTEISLGYLYAPDKIEDVSIKLGGLRAGFGLGLRF